MRETKLIDRLEDNKRICVLSKKQKQKGGHLCSAIFRIVNMLKA